MKQPVAYLNSNDGTGLLAFGVGPQLILQHDQSLETMQEFIDQYSDRYIFLALSYDLKSKTQDLPSRNENYLDFPLAVLWVPETVVKTDGDTPEKYVQGEADNTTQNFIASFFANQTTDGFNIDASFEPRLPKDEYIRHVNALKDEIQYGNIYEVNFCQEFYAEHVALGNPVKAYFRLNEITKAPFSCYFSFENFEILSGSPERYIKREGNKVLSQPIKGTRKRGATPEEDERLKRELYNDPKERSENVMIVDLVRNDLSHFAQPNSVQVDELFGIYSFETVHQMISTISCEVDSGLQFTDILKATFPMGSMTGAPKHSALQLIERHENFQRGLYSGSVGYIAPNGDFDLNVIIRTLIYNSETNYLSCAVGGAITIQCTAEAEYEECNVKVKSILEGMNA